MASLSVDRSLLRKLLLGLSVASLQWLVVVHGAAFYFPADELNQAGPYYYRTPQRRDYSMQQYVASMYDSSRWPQTAPVAMPRAYEAYRTRLLDNRYSRNDPYVRRQWNGGDYYQSYYYPFAQTGGWNGRRDGAAYYARRRQDAVQAIETTTATIASSPRPRKKKLFVPNVWG